MRCSEPERRAAVGAPWVGALGVLMNAETLDGESKPELHLANHPVFAGVSAPDVGAVLAGFAGYFMDMSRHPTPSGDPYANARFSDGRPTPCSTGWRSGSLPHDERGRSLAEVPAW